MCSNGMCSPLFCRPHFPLFDRWKMFCESSTTRQAVNKDVWSVSVRIVYISLIVLTFSSTIRQIVIDLCEPSRRLTLCLQMLHITVLSSSNRHDLATFTTVRKDQLVISDTVFRPFGTSRLQSSPI